MTAHGESYFVNRFGRARLEHTLLKCDKIFARVRDSKGALLT